MTTARRGDRGFSLIEVLVAMLILTIGLLSLAQMMALATGSNTLSGRMTSATALAKEQLERLKAVPFYSDPANKIRNAELVSGGDLDAAVANYVAYYDANGTEVAAGNGLFEVRWRIDTVVPETNPGPGAPPLAMLRIRVRCLPAAGNMDKYAIVGEARFTTLRTANVG